ncbi:MAG: DEAD/DEAH box helicase [Bryobacterales bacterium]|nr:DEAD/DEAH box helicase [Bryobacterales bacterium]MDE0294362.1 DEAD/DEAH box helicase [Bryobacterales bacterium]
MRRPSVEASLKPLKPFQRRTVEHAFHRLFTADDSTGRFLVADEVGLGKTLVARGIIARTIDHLWNKVQRIDIVYICSNASIARANLPKLRVGAADERSFALATRLTMLATELAPKPDRPGLADGRLNFVSFTPGTSFDMGQSGGQGSERAVLFHLLDPLLGRRTALMNLLQGGITRTDYWRWRLDHNRPALDTTIQKRFKAAFNQQSDLHNDMHELFDKWFYRHRPRWPEEARSRRNCVIKNLRRLLAEVCVHALEPDLVILDEFQRFKALLETRDDRRTPAADLAQTLFQATAHDKKPVRTLLLSATPYSLYTADAEIAQEDHYEDFLATTRFLLGDDDDRVTAVKHRLSRFGAALKQVAAGERDQGETVKRAKDDVEASLRAVMARTERVAVTEDHDAMVAEHEQTAAITPSDVRQYLAADALFLASGDRDPMPFWKSAPYLAHFMHGYRFNERLNEMITESPDTVAEVLQRHRPAFLTAEALEKWRQIDPAHAKLRELMRELFDEGLWRLLWIPPTVRYWPLEGPFEGKDYVTKRLLFSAWHVVPDVVSAVLSYEAERLMTAGRTTEGRNITSYEKLAEQQRPLLRFTQSMSKARSRHRLFLLLLPCLSLADRAHPLDAPAGRDRRVWVREQVETLLADAGLPDPTDGEIDDRWEWAAPLLLDPGLRMFVSAWRNAPPPSENAPTLNDEVHLPKPNPELFDSYLDDILAVQANELGRRPPGLVDLLTDAALGSPAILASRCLRIAAGVTDEARRRCAVQIADAFWKLFNRPAVISLIRQLASGHAAAREETAYWRLVLRYCQQGNLQAVLDEQWHLLWEQQAWAEGTDTEVITERCTRALVQAVHPTRSRVHARFFRDGEGHAVERDDDIRIRTVFALRFGQIRTEEDGHISQDAVRAAFKSPFRPFVLTSTSIGQEGLDFHPWCHRVIHWNLPGNPVDLEQREGRVHRYKGHAVRRNVAVAHGSEALMKWRPGSDIWTLIFELAEAARGDEESDLVPFWIAHGKCRVERHVPQLPYTREVEAFQKLKRQLAAYRVVLGQPRQEELVTLLNRVGMDSSQLRNWAVDLSPPDASVQSRQ